MTIHAVFTAVLLAGAQTISVLAAEAQENVIKLTDKTPYYERLGLKIVWQSGEPQFPTKDEINKAFKRMARKVHPDKLKQGASEIDQGDEQKGESDSEEFLLLKAASEFLGDADKKPKYDDLVRQERSEKIAFFLMENEGSNSIRKIIYLNNLRFMEAERNQFWIQPIRTLWTKHQCQTYIDQHPYIVIPSLISTCLLIFHSFCWAALELQNITL